MKKAILYLIILLASNDCTAQNKGSADSSEQRIITTDCENKVFQKVEIPPSLKKGSGNFEDALSGLLRKQQLFINGTNLTYRILVTTSSHVFDIKKEAGESVNDCTIRAFLAEHGSLWRSAIQNGRRVCAYVGIVIVITGDRLTATIRP